MKRLIAFILLLLSLQAQPPSDLNVQVAELRSVLSASLQQVFASEAQAFRQAVFANSRIVVPVFLPQNNAANLPFGQMFSVAAYDALRDNPLTVNFTEGALAMKVLGETEQQEVWTAQAGHVSTFSALQSFLADWVQRPSAGAPNLVFLIGLYERQNQSIHIEFKLWSGKDLTSVLPRPIRMQFPVTTLPRSATIIMAPVSQRKKVALEVVNPFKKSFVSENVNRGLMTLLSENPWIELNSRHPEANALLLEWVKVNEPEILQELSASYLDYAGLLKVPEKARRENVEKIALNAFSLNIRYQDIERKITYPSRFMATPEFSAQYEAILAMARYYNAELNHRVFAPSGTVTGIWDNLIRVSMGHQLRLKPGQSLKLHIAGNQIGSATIDEVHKDYSLATIDDGDAKMGCSAELNMQSYEDLADEIDFAYAEKFQELLQEKRNFGEKLVDEHRFRYQQIEQEIPWLTLWMGQSRFAEEELRNLYNQGGGGQISAWYTGLEFRYATQTDYLVDWMDWHVLYFFKYYGYLNMGVQISPRFDAEETSWLRSDERAELNRTVFIEAETGVASNFSIFGVDGFMGMGLVYGTAGDQWFANIDAGMAKAKPAYLNLGVRLGINLFERYLLELKSTPIELMQSNNFRGQRFARTQLTLGFALFTKK
jgi:hypothetical protein